jgi:hypothetical protein
VDIFGGEAIFCFGFASRLAMTDSATFERLCEGRFFGAEVAF